VNRRLAVRRIAAFMLDWLVILVWAGVLFTIVLIASGGEVRAPSGPWRAQLLGFLTMTLPVAAYFTLCEASKFRGTPGKKAVGLRVVGADGQRLGLGAAVVRNLVKFLPWEFGHLVAQQAVFSTESGMPGWIVPVMVVAYGGPLLWLIELFRAGRTPYDRISGATVTLRSA
jgi:uncharacterized RDD family membrane protein YckC